MKNVLTSFIGIGEMATGIITGALDSQVLLAENVGLYDISPQKLKKFTDRGCKSFETIEELVKSSNTVFLTVRPQNFAEIMPLVKTGMKKNTLLVSIAAGITGEQIRKMVGFPCKVILAMPNAPILLGFGATGIAKMDGVSKGEFEKIKAIFATNGGIVEEVEANQLNNIITISGSTPAFVYKFASAVIDYAGHAGISEEKALNLFAQTLIGSAHMLLESGKPPQELINMVCSPGGTTVEGMNALEKNGFESALTAAFDACINRAEELAVANEPKMLTQVALGSEEYAGAKKLREKELREPLGLKLSAEDIKDDPNVEHFVIIKDGEVVATIQFKDRGNGLGQVKQMVVRKDLQKTGLGKVCMEEIHQMAGERNYQSLVLEARDYAVGFYQKLGYKETEEENSIAGVRHITMTMNLG